jgi:hypothetical protein
MGKKNVSVGNKRLKIDSACINCSSQCIVDVVSYDTAIFEGRFSVFEAA